MVAMAQSKANGQGGGLVPAAGGAVAIPTLLGRSAQRIPVGGRIRAGIKVLTQRPLSSSSTLRRVKLLKWRAAAATLNKAPSAQ